MTTQHRHATEKIITVLCLLATLAVVGTLFMIIGQVFIAGLPSLSWYFITTPENAANGLGAGIANAIVGTILISFCATIVAGPFGFGTAVYMKRYAADNGITRAFRFLLEVLSGTPSVVIGIFGFLIFVIYMKQITGGFSLIAGTLALAILIMPVIERSIEDAIDRVSPELEEGSYSLGANKWQTIRGITIPTAFTGILTGLSLGFGRAAEESAIVLLTAGYTQYMPELGIQSVKGALGGVKIYPLQDSVGTLPYDVYHNFASAGLAKPSSGFAAAFVLIVIVFTINIMGKTILNYGFRGGGSSEGSLFGSMKKRLFPAPANGPTTISLGESEKQDFMFARKDTNKETTKVSAPVIVPDISSATIGSIRKTFPELEADTMTPKSSPDTPVKTAEPAPPSEKPDDSTSISQQLLEAESDAEEKTPVIRDAAGPQKPSPSGKQSFSRGAASITQIFSTLRNRIRILVQKAGKKKPPEKRTSVHDSADHTADMRKANPIQSGRKGTVRPFLITLAPFALVALILMVLTIFTPGLLPAGSGGPVGLLMIAIPAIILCVIGSLGSLFLLKQAKIRIRSRRAGLAAIALGICIIFIAACIFSAHLFAPVVPSPNSNAPAGAGAGLFGFLHLSGSTSANTTDRNARMAAYLAEQETPAQSTPVPHASPAPSPSVQIASSAASAVPNKYALDLGESYWYGDNSRPCLATVYNTSVLPFYFWWDQDWNRFVQQTPVQSGDVFLVIFIRIEDTGNNTAIVPDAASFVVVHNGQTYTNLPFFDTSVLSQNEINYYTAHYNQLPYQWIREIGDQKRDYAFLTGFNVFGVNTTAITTFTTNAPPSPGFDTNGQGYFIFPGRSNAIDGYLIYEVPASVAADLKDTYVQAGFNSFSPAQWRLAKL
jgi:phosphate transport system permease protein